MPSQKTMSSGITINNTHMRAIRKYMYFTKNQNALLYMPSLTVIGQNVFFVS